MRTAGSITVLACSLLAGSLTAQEDFPPVDRDVYRVVNSVAFSPDGDVIYFAVLYHEFLESQDLPTDDEPVTALFSVSRSGDGWATPQLMPFSGQFQDYEPTVSVDGNRMVFNSRRPYPDGQVSNHNDLWMTERVGPNQWSDPVKIESISTFDHEESYGTLMDDGTLVYVQQTETSDGRTDFDLYQSRFVDGAFQEPERHPVSTERWGEADPWVARDGSYVIFTRWDEAIGWAESVDLFIAYSQDGVWTTPVALTDLNTDGPDFGAAVTPDGRWLYYKSSSRFERVALEPLLDRYREAPTPDSLASEVEARELAFAQTMADRDYDAFTSFVAAEAVFLGGGGTLRGRDEVLRAWRPFFEGPTAPFSWRPDTTEVLESGTLALSSGPVFDPDGRQIGRFNSIWRKDPDGQWRVVFDKGS